MGEIDHSGFLNIDKPLHLTSHDVVARLRRRFRALTGSKKVGHAGTLDPLATGVLVLCLGRATRLSDTVMRGAKAYRAEITLGVATTTYDAAGEFVAPRGDTGDLTLAQIESALKRFIGEIQQLPPMYSAVKVKGRKLYELARRGQTIERQPRTIRIDGIDILEWRNPQLKLEIRCGAGAYIRSLAHDLGHALGVGAHLSGLRRLRSGSFAVADSIELARVMQDDAWLRHIISPWEALAHQTRIQLSADEIGNVSRGRAIPRSDGTASEQVFAFSSDRRIVALLAADGDLWKPRKVFWTDA